MQQRVAFVFLFLAGLTGCQYASSAYPVTETKIKVDGDGARQTGVSWKVFPDGWGRYVEQQLAKERVLALDWGADGTMFFLWDGLSPKYLVIKRGGKGEMPRVTADLQYLLVYLRAHPSDQTAVCKPSIYLVRLKDRRAVPVLVTRGRNRFAEMEFSPNGQQMKCLVGHLTRPFFKWLFLNESAYHRSWRTHHCTVDLTQAYADLDGPKAVDIKDVLGGEWFAPPFPVEPAPPPASPEPQPSPASSSASPSPR